MNSARIHSLRRHSTRIALCTALLLAGSAGAAPHSAQVTSVIGDAKNENGALVENTGVGENERVITGEDGKCSMLVDENVVLQLCEKTVAVLKRDPETGNLIIKVEAGKVQVIAEPRLASERIEIHTPAAIATLLGTIVHVEVDPNTKRSTIALTHSSAVVRSTDSRHKGTTHVNTAEQVSMTPGDPIPDKARRLRPKDLERLEPCTLALREEAVKSGQRHAAADTLTEWAKEEGDRVRELTGGGNDSPAAPDREKPLFDGGGDLDDVCSPIDCGGAPNMNPRDDYPKGQGFSVTDSINY